MIISQLSKPTKITQVPTGWCTVERRVCSQIPGCIARLNNIT